MYPGRGAQGLDPRRRGRLRGGGNEKQFRGGLVFKAHSLVHHSTLGLRVIKKKKKKGGWLQGVGFRV